MKKLYKIKIKFEHGYMEKQIFTANAARYVTLLALHYKHQGIKCFEVSYQAI